MSVDENEERDARWFRRDTDRRYPGNAKHRRVWPYALGVPVAVVLAWGAVVIYQQVLGTDPRTDIAVLKIGVRNAPISFSNGSMGSGSF